MLFSEKVCYMHIYSNNFDVAIVNAKAQDKQGTQNIKYPHSTDYYFFCVCVYINFFHLDVQLCY